MFPLLGGKTGVLIPLFWVDRHPVYYERAIGLLERIEGAADVTLVMTDDTVGWLPEYVERRPIEGDGPVRLRVVFEQGVKHLADMEVGAFYWIGADNLHDPKDVAFTLKCGMEEADVVFSDYQRTDEKGPPFPVPHEHRFYFDVNGHSWPDSAVFRTSIFTQFPPETVPRTFILSSMQQASGAGKEPVALFLPHNGFYYYQHDRSGNDRSFIKY